MAVVVTPAEAAAAAAEDTAPAIDAAAPFPTLPAPYIPSSAAVHSVACPSATGDIPVEPPPPPMPRAAAQSSGAGILHQPPLTEAVLAAADAFQWARPHG